MLACFPDEREKTNSATPKRAKKTQPANTDFSFFHSSNHKVGAMLCTPPMKHMNRYHQTESETEVSAIPKTRPASYLAGVFLLVDDDQGVLSRLPLGLGHGALHLGPLTADHFVGLPLGLRHGLLKLRHGLSLHLIHRLFWKECGDRGSQACRTCNITCTVSPCRHILD